MRCTCFALMAKRSRASVLADMKSPQQLYGQLFIDVQMQSLCVDGKTFADARPRRLGAAALLDLYLSSKAEPGFKLSEFVHEHFELPAVDDLPPDSGGRLSIAEHIRALWPNLSCPPDDSCAAEPSRLLLPHAYVVPGGRFREIYYWDSYFTILGLLADGRRDLAEAMLANFAHMIDRLGHIPNGSRTYFLSRSQPPFFAMIAEALGLQAQYLPQMLREHAYWMAGEAELQPGQASSHLVRLPDGSLLNRFWDELDLPRDEAMRDDVLTAGNRPDRPAAEVYRDLRAGCESGWDFSSRWFVGTSATGLASTGTTALLPIDLNALLWHLESTIAELSDNATATEFKARAERRRAAIDHYLWAPTLGYYVDHDWQLGQGRGALTAATVVPLFTGMANQQQADAVAHTVRHQLLMQNGLATSLVESGQQWDAPNGWAPLQWMAVIGLRHYGHASLAADIARRWLGTVERVYAATGRLVEKYNVQCDLPGGGGEYPTQDGFGWTNGVYQALRAIYPAAGLAHAANKPRYFAASLVASLGPGHESLTDHKSIEK
jgi:alpha,alpha-trehalase